VVVQPPPLPPPQPLVVVVHPPPLLQALPPMATGLVLPPLLLLPQPVSVTQGWACRLLQHHHCFVRSLHIMAHAVLGACSKSLQATVVVTLPLHAPLAL
jgi:hypothetical protein